MLTVGMAAGFTSCKDYDDDINNLQEQVDAIKKSLTEIEGLVNKGVIITGVTKNDDGIVISMSNGESYPITNGKPGAPGKDAVVWSIVKNAEGKYVWAQDGVATEFPAQGEPGAPGAGIYYVPNKDGFFYKVEDGKDPVKTDIPCFAPGALTAVDDGSNIIIKGILDENGKETEPFVLSKTGALSSLEFIPDLYVNGIETMPINYVNTYISTATKFDNADKTDGTATSKYVIKKGEYDTFTKLTTGTDAQNVKYRANEIAKYFLNPANANLSQVKEWGYFTNDATVSRSSKAVATVVGNPTAEDGVLTVTYTLGDIDNVLTASTTAASSKQTIMALQATLNDNSVVYSNFVALKKQLVTFGGIKYATSPITNSTPATSILNVLDNSVAAATATSNEINVAWDKTTDLTKYIRIAYTVAGETGTKYYTIKEMQEKFGMTMSYAILKYDKKQSGISTAQNNYGLVDANGIFTPTYMRNGQQVSGVTDPNQDEIGREPVVVLQLKDANGKLIYGGFITLIIKNLGTQSAPIVLSRKAVLYASCNNATYATTGAEFNQEVLVPLNISAANFDTDYTFDGSVIGVSNDGGKTVTALPASNSDTGESYNYGTFTYTKINGSGAEQTQGLKFTATLAQLLNWNPVYKSNGKVKGYELTDKELPKTLYAKFTDKGGNILWVGVDITFTGIPTITNVGGYLARWNADHTMAPVNPADPAVATMTDAKIITVNNEDLWSQGNPIFTANAPYNFTNDQAANYLATAPVMEFAEDQSFTLAGKNSAGENATIKVIGDGANLIAYTKVDGNGDPADPQTIATITNGTKITFTAGSSALSYVNQIITSAPYSVQNPTILFDVELYANYGVACPTSNLLAPAKTFKIGVGNPVIVSPTNPIAQVTDHGTTDQITLPLGNIISIKDWAGNPFVKNVKETQMVDGKPVEVVNPNKWEGNEIINGRWVLSYWMGTNGVTLNVTDPIKGSTTGSLADAVVYSNVEVTVTGNATNIRDFNTKVTITNKGTQFTQDVTIFIPVTVNAVWGPFSTNIPVKIVKTDKGSN